jgi:hypothetical protein
MAIFDFGKTYNGRSVVCNTTQYTGYIVQLLLVAFVCPFTFALRKEFCVIVSVIVAIEEVFYIVKGDGDAVCYILSTQGAYRENKEDKKMDRSVHRIIHERGYIKIKGAKALA